MNVKTFDIECSGYAVVADWYEGKTKDKILLTLPGYSSTRLRQKKLVSAIVEKTGISALVFEYSGHGDSPFELRNTRPAQHFLEVIYVFDWIKQNYPDSHIFVMGSSYGGFLATKLTKYREFDKLVLKVPAMYKPEVFYDLWSARIDNEKAYDITSQRYRKDIKALSSHPLFARVGKFKGKVLVVVHGKDDIVPKQTTDAFIKAFNADTFTAINFKHSISDDEGEYPVAKQEMLDYQNKIANWLSK